MTKLKWTATFKCTSTSFDVPQFHNNIIALMHVHRRLSEDGELNESYDFVLSDMIAACI